MGKERIINLLVGPVLFLLCAFLLPEGIFWNVCSQGSCRYYSMDGVLVDNCACRLCRNGTFCL